MGLVPHWGAHGRQLFGFSLPDVFFPLPPTSSFPLSKTNKHIFGFGLEQQTKKLCTITASSCVGWGWAGGGHPGRQRPNICPSVWCLSQGPALGEMEPGPQCNVGFGFLGISSVKTQSHPERKTPRLKSSLPSTFPPSSDFLQPRRKYFPRVPEDTGRQGEWRLPQSQPTDLKRSCAPCQAQTGGARCGSGKSGFESA